MVKVMVVWYYVVVIWLSQPSFYGTVVWPKECWMTSIESKLQEVGMALGYVAWILIHIDLIV